MGRLVGPVTLTAPEATQTDEGHVVEVPQAVQVPETLEVLVRVVTILLSVGRSLSRQNKVSFPHDTENFSQSYVTS